MAKNPRKPRSPTERWRLTDAAIAKLETPASGRRIVYDEAVKPFGVRLTPKGTRSFIVNSRVNGKPRIVLLGHFPGLSVDRARKIAKQRIGDIAERIDPNQAKRDAAKRGKALEALFLDFRRARNSKLRARTLGEYQRILDKQLSDWKPLPYLDITPEMVEARFVKLTDENGPGAANLAMRMLRAVLNFGEADPNPVKRLSRGKRWHRLERRQTAIKDSELPEWWKAVNALADGDAGDLYRDYLLTLLLTGLRKNEAARLRIRDVDLRARTLTIPDPKNRRRHTLPMGERLHEIVKRRAEAAPSPWIFSGPSGAPINDPRKQIAKVTKESGVSFMPHDLRRTFATIAESLDLSSYTLKHLMNHKTGSDVTAGYLVFDVERLRGPMQQIETEIFTRAKA